MRDEQAWYVTSDQLKDMLFPEAAEIWLATREPYVSPNPLHEYKGNIKALSKFLGDLRLKDIGADQIRRYQQARGEQCGPFSINHECSVVQQMLKRVGLWHFVSPNYEPLPLPNESVGKVLAPDERKRLFETAKVNPNWQAAFIVAMLSVNTSAGPKEIATLRLKDIDLEKRTLTVQAEGAKNGERIRSIPLNAEALKAAEMALVRAKKLGAGEPHHYVFPFRANKGGIYDPFKHQTTFKTAWINLRKKAALPAFRMYDLRHTAITIMLEDPRISEETVEAIAGHVGRRMKKVYSHVRMGKRRLAVSAIDGSPVPEENETARLMPENAITNERVLNMLATGFSGRIVAERIRKASAKVFDVSDEGLKKLNDSHVPECVILAMLRAS